MSTFKFKTGDILVKKKQSKFLIIKVTQPDYFFGDYYYVVKLAEHEFDFVELREIIERDYKKVKREEKERIEILFF